MTSQPNQPTGSGPTGGDVDWVPLYLVSLMLVALLLVVAAVGQVEDDGPRRHRGDRGHLDRHHHGGAAPALPRTGPTSPTSPTGKPAPRREPALPAYPSDLPGGRTAIFAGRTVLVAYYGTAGTGSLGVLGEAGPERIVPRLIRAAQPFAAGGRTVQPVFELIVTVAHAGPTKTGAYSSDIARTLVQQYIEAAHRHGALVVLDLQPGRADFLDVAKRWEWALRDPWVGLALDPEWRMGPHGVPGRRIGSVSAAEINRTSRWLDDLTIRNGLPQKLFVLHQFRTDMIRHLDRVASRPALAMVQHVDGYGPPRAKLATFHAVARPSVFTLGFKLFYDEDKPRMTPARVLRIRPAVRFVSFQ
ncbi:MAG: hypothetical protein ACJ72D_17825 [Marmoricola sp.]